MRYGKILLFVAVLALFWQFSLPQEEAAIGGPSPDDSDLTTVLENKDDILQDQFDQLHAEQDRIDRERTAVTRLLVEVNQSGDRSRQASLEQRLDELATLERTIHEARVRLTALKNDHERYEQLLTETYQHMHYQTVSAEPVKDDSFVLAWPVLPESGFSATFEEESYAKRFGIEHYAVDIPALQGTPIRSAGSGIVEAVHDRGYGYSTVSVAHAESVSTLYGHVSEILVREGQPVSEGQIIAKSGGLPGTLGAGPLTTGAHLHFEVHKFGQPIDPEYYLPPVTMVVDN